MPDVPAVTPQRFFEELYRGIGGSFIEIRPLLDSSDPQYKTEAGSKLESSSRRFFAIEKNGARLAAEYCLTIKGLHVYFGVGLRATPGSGKKSNIGCVPAAFADVDFKHIAEDQAIARIRALPFKPSIVVLSGGGAHVYWILQEPVFQSGLKRLEALNRKLLEACGAQVGTQDATRILRVPGTANVKPDYPDPKPVTKVALFQPDRRYDFDAMLAHFRIPLDPIPPVEASTVSSGGNIPPTLTPLPEANTSGGGVVIPPAGESANLDDLALSQGLLKVIREGLPAYVSYRKETDTPEKFEKRQKDNQLSRSEADAYVVSNLLAAGATDLQIFSVFRDPQNKVGEKYRERRDGDHYLGVTVQKMRTFRAEHPRAQNAAERVGRQLSHQFRDDRFEIQKIVKATYRDPIFWVTTFAADNPTPSVTKCSAEELDCFRRFRLQHLLQNNKFPPPLNQAAWESLVNGVEFEIQKVEEELSTVEAEITEAFSEWSTQAHSELTESNLQYLPVHDPESDKVYMRVKPFMQYLTSDKIEAKKKDVLHVIKRMGFSMEAKRVGKTLIKLWSKKNGQMPPPPGVTPLRPPPPPQEPPHDTLFP